MVGHQTNAADSTAQRIFVSHSVANKALVDALVDLFITGIGVSRDSIFCASLEGCGIPEGKDFKLVIHSELQRPALVLLAITPSYYESVFCLCELGATWAMSHSCFPLLVPPMEYKDLEAVLKNTQVGRIDDASSLDNLRDRVLKQLHMEPGATAQWNVKRDQFLARLPAILAEMPGFTKVSADKHAQLRKDYELSMQLLIEKDDNIDRLKAENEKLKGLKDREEVSRVILESSDEPEQFEVFLKRARSAVKTLPKVVLEALFYEFEGGLFSPPIYEQGKWEEIRHEIENKYLYQRESDGAVCADLSDPKISRAMDALTSLRSFIDGATGVFRDAFVQEHDYGADMTSRRFWAGQLYL